MSRFRAFIVPFAADGTYGDEIEVTADTDIGSIGNISQKIDNNQYNVGLLTYNDFNLKLRNEHGKYSNVGDTPSSIFNIKRNDSIFRLYWQIDSFLPICGIAICGQARLSPITLVYEGLIKDDATSDSPKSQFTRLKVLSLESKFDQIEVPNGLINNGDTFESALFDILNQTIVTDLFTVDAANINVGFDTTIDDAQALSSQNGKNALDNLLLLSNSIIYIKERTIYISARVASTDSQFTFYGPASVNGLENTQNISDIRTGVSKSFNYWTWQDETFNVEDATNRALYGVRRKQISSALITGTAKKQAILAALVGEFGAPRKSFKVTTPINYETIPLFYLDKINVDYPTVYIPSEGRDLPFYDVAKYDESFYPLPDSFLTIDINKDWRIAGRTINVKSQLITFDLREV